MESKYRGRLVVGEHSLHCHGARREARYGRPGVTKGYDGVHFRTKEGKKAFTDSLARILKKEEVGSVVEEVEQDSQEWEVAGGRGRRAARRMEAESTWADVAAANRYSVLN